MLFVQNNFNLQTKPQITEIEIFNIREDMKFSELTQGNRFKYYSFVNDKIEQEFSESSIIFENIQIGRNDLIILCSRIV